MYKDTNQLFSEASSLVNIEEVNNFYADNEENMFIPDPINYLLDIMANKNISKAELIKKSGLDRTYAYHILSKEKKLTRDKLIILAIAANLSLDETMNFLKYARQNPLYIKDKRDGLIIFAINNNFSVIDTNHLLSDNNFKLLK